MLCRTPQELLPFVLGDIGRFLDANVPNREKMEQDRFTEVTIMTRACEIYLEASISSTHNAPFCTSIKHSQDLTIFKTSTEMTKQNDISHIPSRSVPIPFISYLMVFEIREHFQS